MQQKLSKFMDEQKFAEIVNKAKKYIHDGDIFQVVLSRKFNFESSWG